MKIMEGYSLLPSIDICWYVWKQKRHYYVTFHWLFWYWSSLKKFAWEEEGGEQGMISEEEIQSESHRVLNKESIPDNNHISFEKGFCLGAKWADKQMVELWNVARNVYEAWMGGTMNDVRECMKDLGHVFDEFKN